MLTNRGVAKKQIMVNYGIIELVYPASEMITKNTSTQLKQRVKLSI